ncbi:TonB-dependent receptor [Novosphingobium sp. PS1R-30]|uniref:TonB-dependent receptor n=1 Tax=Novosphingobium anseongense TaxID=3133436 RepID=A0ABU8RTD2_9SPHN
MKGIRAFALAGVSLLSVATPAFAQDKVAKDADEVGFSDNEIVVSARRREESLQDVPLVVNAVTAETLDKLNIREFKDVASLVPGLQLGQSQNGIGAQATLRGVAYDVNASGNNGTIEFYLNEAHISAGQLFISMYDVGQIEVLRGPQGTLRGRASPSGSITVGTRKPVLDQAGGYLNGFVNDIHGWNINGAINVPIIEDKLAIRVAGVMDQNQENRVRSINNPLDPHQETQSGRVSIRFEPFDFLTLNGNYSRTQRKSRSFYQAESASLRDPAQPASAVVIRAEDRLSTMNQPARYTQDYEVFNWSGQLRLAGQKLDYVGAVNKQKYVTNIPSDTGGFYDARYSLALRSANQATNTSGKEVTHEFRLSNEERIGGMFDYVVGYFYDKLDSPTALIQQTPVFGGIVSPNTLLTIANTPITRGGGSVEKSFFGNLTAHIGDQLEISGGLRHIKYHSDGFLTIAGAPVAAAAENRDLKATIYSASVTYRFTPDLMVYASTGSSWRPGSSTNPTILREIANPSPLLSSFYFPQPERSKSYEIGLKSEWFDKRLRLNLTAYHQDFENYAYSSRNIFIAASRSVNGALVPNVFTAGPAIAVGVPAKVEGVEAEIGFRVTDRFDIGATLSYALSKIKNGRIPCNDYSPRDGVPDAAGSVPTFAQIQTANGGEQVAVCSVNYRAGVGAPFSATVTSEFSQPIGFGDAYLRGLFTYQGDSQNDPANAFDNVKAYGLLNLFAGIRSDDGSWDIGVYGKNITNVGRVLNTPASVQNVTYQVAGATGVVGGVGLTTYRQVQLYTNPREFGVNFTARFGSR